MVKHFLYFGFILLLPTLILSCGGKAPKDQNIKDQNISSGLGKENSNRSLATDDSGSPEKAPEEAEFELRFQEILHSGNIEKGMIFHLDRLYQLAIETNRNIQEFEKDLDQKLKERAKDPNAEVTSPLESSTYKKLIKLWALSDLYQAEIQYFFLRSLQIRTDRSLPREERLLAGEIKKKVVNHLNNANLSQRAELQDLALLLQQTFEDFVADYKKKVNKNDSENNKDEPEKGEESIKSSEKPFARFLFSNAKQLQKLYDTHQIVSIPQLTGKGLVRQREFLDGIEKDLKFIPDPTIGRDPDSDQNLNCDGNKRICVNSGESGNIVGAVFPKGVWAFTYDDGPAAQSTSDMMELIHNYSDKVNPVGKATFFWLAKNVVSYPKWVKKGFEYGFPLENHSFSHANFAKLGPAGLNHEIVESNKVLESAFRKIDTNYVIQYFRCPYGACYSPKLPNVRNMLVNQKQIHVYWRIDSLDWKVRNGTQVANLVTKQMQLLDHGVILMHDIHPSTVEGTRQILAWMKNQNNNLGRNYKMVTIPEAVDLVNGK